MHGKRGFASRFLAIPLYDLDGTSKLTRGMVIPCRMQNLKSVAALGEELGRKEVKWKTTIFRKSDFLQEKLALRGSLAVTWLTVYRQLQVPTQVTRPAPGPGTYVWQNRVRVKISRDSSIRSRRDVKTNTGNGNTLPHAKPQVRSCTW